MNIIAITNPYELKFEEMIANKLFEEGLAALHLRKPEFSKQDYITYIENIEPRYHNRIVLHQYYSLTKIYDIDTIHVPYSELKSKISSFIINMFAISHDKNIKKVTTLTHYKSLGGNYGGADSILFGPIFAKAAIEIANPLMDANAIKKGLSKSNVVTSALGGVSLHTLPSLIEMGFESVALQSALWKTIDPIQEFIKIRDYKPDAKSLAPHLSIAL